MSQPPTARREVLRCAATAAAAAASGSWVSSAWAQAGLQGLPATVANVRNSVVPVGTFSATASPRFGFRGTGFVVGDGSLVATNFHVLPAAAAPDAGAMLAVLTPKGTEAGTVRMARVVATDRTRDLALLKIEGAALPALSLEDSGGAREGQSIALMGFPIGGALGFSPVTHRGIVASVTTGALPAPTAQQLDPRAITRLREGNFEVLQLDATAYPGNSGGPVFDADTGRVLGLVSWVLVKEGRETALTNPTGISYAIPVRYLIDLMRTR